MEMGKLKISSFCSGVGSFEVAIKNLEIEHEIVLSSEIDKYARETYFANHSTKKMVNDMTEPDYIGEEYYSDLNVSGLPCQSFSLAGKRLGELDPRGLLFFDFLRYVKNQNPKYFIIENVKGLLSDAGGETFRNWIQLLGQSENGNTFMFPHEDSLMYNLHWQVLNTKDYGLPQNRERVFLIGIRNDLPNDFNFPKTIPLKLRLKDILEDQVDEKYYLSEKMINYLTTRKDNFNGGKINFKNGEDVASCINASSKSLDISDNIIQIGNVNPSGNGMNGNVFSDEGLCPTLTTNKGEGIKIQVKSATKCGYEIATEGDSINLSNINSETRRGRVGKQVAQTLDTACNQSVIIHNIKQQVTVRKFEVNTILLKEILIGSKKEKGISIKEISEILNTEKTKVEHWFRNDKSFAIPDANIWFDLKKLLNINRNDFDKPITEFITKDGVFEKADRVYDEFGIAPTLTSTSADEKIMIYNQSVMVVGNYHKSGHEASRIVSEEGIYPTMKENHGTTPAVMIKNGTSNCLSTVQKDNLVVSCVKHGVLDGYEQDGRIYEDFGISSTLDTKCSKRPLIHTDFRIRKLTPLECFRLQGFPDYFVARNNLLKDINNSGILLYICNEFKNYLLCNVKAKTAIEKQKDLDTVLCTIRDSENTGTQTLFSNFPTEEMKNVRYKVAIQVFMQKDFAYHTTTQTENTETLYIMTINDKKLSTVLLHQKENEGLEKMEDPSTDLLLKITLDESWMSKKSYIISTLIHTIMKSIISMSILPNQNTLKVIVSYGDCTQNLPQNFSKKELLFLKTANTGFVSSSQLYKQAGNTISVNVIQAILKNLLKL